MIIKNPIKAALMRGVNFYRRARWKPFANILRKFHLKYMQKLMLQDKTVVANVQGIKYELYLRQPSEMEMYYGGGYEPAVIKVMKKYVKPGNTIIDVGARIGLHTFRLKRLAGERGRVLALEPDKESFSRLIKNAELNNCSIEAENKALSDRSQKEEITLDDFVKIKKIDKLDFIKIDTDGAEYRIIKGGELILKKQKPLMVMEFNKETLRDGVLEPMMDLLTFLGYSFFQIVSLRKYPDKRTIINEVVSKGNVNVLCQ